jgi:F-type H+-transporting ATPase subunit delta
MSIAVASRYARALADIVVVPGAPIAPREALEQVRAFQQVLEVAPELSVALMSLAVPAGRKRAVVRQVADRLGVARVIRNFLSVVVDHRRVALVPRIADALEKTLDDRMGIVRATVTSAGPLGDAQRRQLEGRLVERTGKQVRCDYRSDAGLLGGLSVQIGSTIYDGSVRGRLAALRARLVSAAHRAPPRP